jgi:hypothetical protein
MEIKIRTGANISNILQSTVTYEQAFTELIKNSIQNGATFVDIILQKERALILDDGIGFEHKPDEGGMSGFDKYFVFGNSYDMSGGAGPKMGHMGIGGKVSNDKLTDSENPHWTIETKNKSGRCFHVEYKREKTEFLDDYNPILSEIEPTHSNIKTAHGTIIAIHNLDPALRDQGWRFDSIKKEIRHFFGELVRNKKKFEIYINGESLEFDYALPGYAFTPIVREFEYEHFGVKKKSTIKFNLSLLQAKEDEDEYDSIYVVSEVKISELKLTNQKILNKVFEEIVHATGGKFRARRSVLNAFGKMRGFIDCKDLSIILDHTGMPAKDLSHHALREDHPITNPFYECVYKTIIDLLRGYLLLHQKDESKRQRKLASKVIGRLVADFGVSDDMLIDYGTDDNNDNLASRIKKARVGEDVQKELLQTEIDNSLKNEKRPGIRRRIENNIKEKFRDKKPAKKETQEAPNRRGVRYEIKSFGTGQERVMSSHNKFGDFCVNINSDNPKFISVEPNEKQFASYIAELVIREILKFRQPLVNTSEIDEAVSDFYTRTYPKL